MQGSSATANVIVLIIVAALVVFRNMRPQKMTVSRFWVFPIIIVVLTGFVFWTSVQTAPGSLWDTVIAAIVGLLVGIPFGMARGHHSQVKLSEQPGVFFIQPSAIVMIVWLIAFIVKFGVRAYLPQAGPIAVAATDGFLFFAIVSVAVSRYMIFQKYEALAAAKTT